MASTHFQSRSAHWVYSAIFAACALVACSGQGKDAKSGAAAGAGAQAPAPVVGVITAQPTTVAITTELPGRLEANRIAQVRARTPGVIQRRLFREGGEVREGQSLFQIDNSVQAASLASAKAAQAKAEAALASANDTARRYQPLVEANAISKQEYQTALSNQRAAVADVNAAKAAVRNAQITMGYTQVLAPISGQIGKASVTEGALVGQGEATLLATIQQLNPMVINFTQSASEMMRLRTAAGNASGSKAVKIVLDDGRVYDQPGRLLFADATVDATTGQVNLKAEVPNPNKALLPGLYVRVLIEQSVIENAVVVPQQAVTRGTTDTVMVVNADGTYAPRPVKVGPAQGNNWVITGGLNAGDQVIVDGLSTVMMMHAQKVTPQPWQPPAAGASAAPASAASVAAPAASAASEATPAASAASH